ncbi:MAG TPA: hypothetical protein VEA44_14795 [Caulobacter sp.]|nr:hypothetical protein [Caulobacter sp.]
MIAFLVVLVLGILAGLSIAAVRRERKARAVRAFAEELRQRRRLEAMYVSKLDRSFIGFRFSDRTLVLGDGSMEREYPFSAIRDVEVMREETPDPRGDPENGWLKRLAVRVAVDDPERPEHLYRILDWPSGRGLPSAGVPALGMNDQAERVRGQLLDAMAAGAAA